MSVMRKKFNGSEYNTDNRRVHPLARLSPSLYFYTTAVGVIAQAAWKARRGTFNLDELVHGSASIADQVEKTGGSIHVTGLDMVANLKGSCVFVANHMSSLETLVLPSLILPHVKLTFVVKAELMEHPLMGPILTELNPITVSRGNPREDLKQVLEKGAEHLAAGWSVCLFPQTTRHLLFDASRFNTLAEKLALRAAVPIVPVAVKTDFWPPGRIVKDFGRIRPGSSVQFSFGGPLVVDRLNQRDVHIQILDFIMGKLSAWGVEVTG